MTHNTASVSALKTPHVLIVDDEPEIIGLLKDAFFESGWQVSSAANGREALAAMDHKVFDAVLSDLTMPELNGVELIRQSKLKEQHADVPFFILSGTLNSEYLESIDNLGVSQVLMKPFDPFAVVRKVQTKYLHSHADDRTSDVDFDPEIMECVMRSMQELTHFYLGELGRVGQPSLKMDRRASGYFTALVPFHQGGTIASVAFSCNKAFLKRTYHVLFPQRPQYKDVSRIAADIAREMCNQIGGRMKNYLVRKGYDISLGIPKVSLGPHHKIDHPLPGPAIQIPITTDSEAMAWVELAMSGTMAKSKPSGPIDLFGEEDEDITFFF
jgi:CheY-like chemotaxis protein/CheY-specific phosphatase CheX